MTKATREPSRPVMRPATRDELRRERDGRPKGKPGAAGAGGGPPEEELPHFTIIF